MLVEVKQEIIIKTIVKRNSKTVDTESFRNMYKEDLENRKINNFDDLISIRTRKGENTRIIKLKF